MTTQSYSHPISLEAEHEAKFWDALALYKTTKTKANLDELKQFEDVFDFYHGKLCDIMFNGACEVDQDPGSSIFNNDEFGIGADDGHDYLCYEIIWSGKQAVDTFTQNPKSALHIARIMSIAGSKGYDEFKQIFYSD